MPLSCAAFNAPAADRAAILSVGTTMVMLAAIYQAFDALWKVRSPWQKVPPPMNRKAAYRWLQTTLKLTKDEAHIGRFTVERCEELIVAVKAAQKAGG